MKKGIKRGGCLAFLGSLIAIAGCVPYAMSGEQRINQASHCHATEFQEIERNCDDGDVLGFLPSRWGNEQTPIAVIAAACNTNHPIQFNNSGVVCVFTGERMATMSEEG